MLANDTIRLFVEFKNFEWNTIHPNNVQLKIYDVSHNLIETITEDIIADGDKYFYDYTALNSDFVYEFSGIYNDKTVLARDYVKVQFTK